MLEILPLFFSRTPHHVKTQARYSLNAVQALGPGPRTTLQYKSRMCGVSNRAARLRGPFYFEV